MMIFKKAIPRRTFLKGVGATLALPLLDGMVPAFAGPADTAAKINSRLLFVYLPNGVWPMDRWTPKAVGSNYELTPFLAPLAPYRDRMLVLSGLAHQEADALEGDGGGSHSCACSSYLTGIRPSRGGEIRAGVSVDQVAAQEFGKHTQLGSLELSLANTEVVGICEGDYSCTYTAALSWRGPTTPLPVEYSPRAVFERLFGDSDTTDSASRRARLRQNHSLLDFVGEDLGELMKGVGPSDRSKLSEYLDAIRDVERRIQVAEEQSSRELPLLERPAGVPDTFKEFYRIMADLQVLAYQADLTRVVTLMLDREGPWGGRAYPEIGIDDLHHTISHHQNDPDKVEKLFQISLYHVKQFTYFLDRLQSTHDGDGSLLDHTLLVYGGSLSNPNGHIHENLPVLLFGGGASPIKGGRHLRFPEKTPMANLYLNLLEKLGMPTEKFGNSTGKLDLTKSA